MRALSALKAGAAVPGRACTPGVVAGVAARRGAECARVGSSAWSEMLGRPCRQFATAPSSATLSGTAKSKLEKAKRQARKKSASQLIKVRSGPTFHVDEAIKILKALSRTAFDQTVDVQVQLGIDPRKTNVTVRGVAQLPAGSGKAVTIAVFAKGEKAEEARKAGAQIVGAEDLVERIGKGDVAFTKTIATPDMMPLVGRVARVLGPRGLMPNPKLGTVTLNVKDAVAAAKRGQAEFRAEKRGIVSTGIGKLSFSAGDLRDNLRALLLALHDTRPDGFKGVFVRQAFLSSTMGPGIPLDLAVIDPGSAVFMSTWSGVPANLQVAQAAQPAAPARATAAA